MDEERISGWIKESIRGKGDTSEYVITMANDPKSYKEFAKNYIKGDFLYWQADDLTVADNVNEFFLFAGFKNGSIDIDPDDSTKPVYVIIYKGETGNL